MSPMCAFEHFLIITQTLIRVGSQERRCFTSDMIHPPQISLLSFVPFSFLFESPFSINHFLQSFLPSYSSCQAICYCFQQQIQELFPVPRLLSSLFSSPDVALSNLILISIGKLCQMVRDLSKLQRLSNLFPFPGVWLLVL